MFDQSLDGRVRDPAAGQRDELDDCGVQRVRRVYRRRAALDVVDLGALVRDDQRPLELAHVLGVDAEVRLQRLVDDDPRGHVDEVRTPRPDRRVQGGELVVVRAELHDTVELRFAQKLPRARDSRTHENAPKTFKGKSAGQDKAA